MGILTIVCHGEFFIWSYLFWFVNASGTCMSISFPKLGEFSAISLWKFSVPVIFSLSFLKISHLKFGLLTLVCCVHSSFTFYLLLTECSNSSTLSLRSDSLYSAWVVYWWDYLLCTSLDWVIYYQDFCLVPFSDSLSVLSYPISSPLVQSLELWSF